MEYLLLFIACTFFALQFVFQKLFEVRTVDGMAVCFWNQMICCTVSLTFLILKSGLPSGLDFSAILFVLAYAACGILCNVCSITAMGCGKVAAVSTFCLAGGMVVPYFYGILALDEPQSPGKWLGLMVLCLSLVPSVTTKEVGDGKKGKRGKFVFCCTIIFLTNGFVSVFSKMYMNYMSRTVTDEVVLAVAEDNFIKLSSVVQCLTAVVVLLLISVLGKKTEGENSFRRNFWEIGRERMTGWLFLILIVFAGAYAVCNTLGNLFSLRCMDAMDASIQFPLLSAVVILLTAVFGLIFFKEKIGKATALSLGLSVIGIGLFMIP